MTRRLEAGGVKHVAVASAGIAALPCYPAPRRVIEVAEENGLDVAGHRSAPLDGSLLEWADIILIMESYMGDEISRAWPEKDLDKISLLGSYAAGDKSTDEIRDPYGGSSGDFQQCYAEIEAGVLGLIDTLLSKKAH